MIRNEMKECSCYTISSDAYGSTSIGSEPDAHIMMSVHLTDYDTQQNTIFAGSSYIGLTQDDVKYDWYIASSVASSLLKINYILKKGRYTQVYMQESGKLPG